jgi:hypothetical protein
MTTQYEYYNTGDDNYWSIYGAYWKAQTFTVGAAAHSITSVKLKLYRYNSPGLVTVSIRATASGVPTGGDLTSGTIDGNSLALSPGAWYEITLTQYSLLANTKYAIVIRAPSGNSSNHADWRCDGTSPTYSGGSAANSTDSGVTWYESTSYDYMFEVWGNPSVVIPTVTTQAATSIGLD